MENFFKQVKQFNHAAGADISDSPRIPGYETQELRVKLIQEETKELDEALAAGDKVESLDAICDLLYVVLGAAQAIGVDEDLLTTAFNEVHRSNMSKFCTNTDDARNSANDYTIKKKIDAYYQKRGSIFAVLRVEDNKILKGNRFSKPKLKEIIERHENKKRNEQQQKTLL